MTIDLTKIQSPADIKALDFDTLQLLSDELRVPLIKKLAARGGHAGPNLGVVEATVALHYVFDAPKDEIVFDVSHQSYIHKMLTGRINAFLDPEKYGEVTGFTCPHESKYDLFEIGHTSTSISLAIGLAKARDLKGGKQNVIAFIGDASLGGGMALEGLDYAPTLGTNFILIINDNQMSIAENHGELYRHLEELRNTDGHASNNIFKALGYEYYYVAEGNDIRHLVKVFEEVKDTDHAVVVHINTMKGKGLPVAEADKESFHYTAPFDPKTGAPANPSSAESYTDMFALRMLEMARENKDLVVMNAGTPGAVGLYPDRRAQLGKQYVDVGIAEQNCVTMAAGLAKGGARPVMAVVATFLQRAYDQLSHDVAINNLPAVFVDFAGGIFSMNDVTHLGFFDVAMVSNIPNIVMIAPANAEEFMAMTDWAVKQTEHPVVIRTPGGKVCHTDRPVNMDFFRYDVVEEGQEVAVIGEGAMFATAQKAIELMKEKGLKPTLINPRILSSIDKECLDTLKGYRQVITIDDGIIDGGFGEKVAAYLSPKGVKVNCLGLKKEFLDRYNFQEVLTANGMTPQQICDLALSE